MWSPKAFLSNLSFFLEKIWLKPWYTSIPPSYPFQGSPVYIWMLEAWACGFASCLGWRLGWGLWRFSDALDASMWVFGGGLDSVGWAPTVRRLNFLVSLRSTAYWDNKNINRKLSNLVQLSRRRCLLMLSCWCCSCFIWKRLLSEEFLLLHDVRTKCLNPNSHSCIKAIGNAILDNLMSLNPCSEICILIPGFRFIWLHCRCIIFLKLPLNRRGQSWCSALAGPSRKSVSCKRVLSDVNPLV